MKHRGGELDRPSPAVAARTLCSVLVAAALACAVAMGPSCVSLLELDGYASTTRELCEVLGQCYGAAYLADCEAHVGERLDGATAAEREAWLVYFADNNCLASCLNARRCLDERPLCAPLHAGCSQTEHCCGFSQGTGDCRTGAGGDGACCLPDGLRCTDGGECCAKPCESATCDEGPCHVCGGKPCKLAGEPCLNDFQCCSGICDPRSSTCHDDICLDNGAECTQSFECCSSFCHIPPGASVGFCDDPTCVLDGDACSTPEECCGGYCVEVDAASKVCSSAPCLPDETPCQADEQCCSNHCDPTHGRCALEEPCLPVGAPCEKPEDCCYPSCEVISGTASTCACIRDGDPCQEQYECCSGMCSGDGVCGDNTLCLGAGSLCDPGIVNPQTDLPCCSGVCGVDGRCCRTAVCARSVCEAGWPLDPTCLTCEHCQTGNGDPCPGLVCQDDAYATCCCHWWTGACVTRATAVCGHLCPIDPV